MEFSRQEDQNGLPFPSLGDLPNPGIELVSAALTDRLYHIYLFTFSLRHWIIYIFFRINSTLMNIIGDQSLNMLCFYSLLRL